jgi:hypothetical protein|tara:strand:+ start:2412 stop:3506 length:1095 start_codon:yes stop_codon:yes gene_type:complete
MNNFSITFSVLAICITLNSFDAALFAQTPGNIEAAEYDPSGNRWFISNNSSLLETSNGGESYTYFGNATASHGMEVIDGHLFALGNNVIRAYELETAALIGSYSIPGAGFLNGMGSRAQELVVSDFSNGKIHRVDITDPANMSSTVLVNNTGTTPNGVVIDEGNNRAIIVNWGASASILAIDLTTEEQSTVVANTGLGNLDGVDMDGEGRFYISSWSPARITRYSNDFTSSESVVQGAGSGLSNPADISYSIETDTLGVANSGNGTPSFHSFGSTSDINQLENTESVIWDGRQLRVQSNLAGTWNLSSYSISGQLMAFKELELPNAPTSISPERLGIQNNSGAIWRIVSPSGKTYSVKTGPRQW